MPGNSNLRATNRKVFSSGFRIQGFGFRVGGSRFEGLRAGLRNSLIILNAGSSSVHRSKHPKGFWDLMVQASRSGFRVIMLQAKFELMIFWIDRLGVSPR